MSVDATTATASSLSPARAQIAGAIKQASQQTGASFEYLVAAAKIESNLQSRSVASTSSARGLFQFIDQTWLGTVKEAGSALGYGRYADAITRQRNGGYTVSDPAMRDEILKLRDDPAASAAMAGALTNANSFRLVGAIGRRPADNELYIAHFLGIGGASRLIKANETNPEANAAQMFPKAAAANRSIFYDRSGQARSVGGVYAELTRRYSEAANSKAVRTAIAAVGAPSDTVVAAGNYLAAFPQAAVPSPAGAAVQAVDRAAAMPTPATRQVASLSDDRPMFRTLFQVGGRPEPVSPAVRDLWVTGPGPGAQGAPSSDIKLKTPTPLDLFSDRNGTFSG